MWLVRYLLHIQRYYGRKQCRFEIVILVKTSGLLLAFATVLLQIAVFLQPLLPEQYQIAPVCETISNAFSNKLSEAVDTQNHSNTANRFESHFIDHDRHQQVALDNQHHHHDANHQCQYCTFYANLILPPEIGIKETLVRIQIRLLAYVQTFRHVYFDLQQLYLIPQSRAPPTSLAI